jgi:hypothetical protein
MIRAKVSGVQPEFEADTFFMIPYGTVYYPLFQVSDIKWQRLLQSDYLVLATKQLSTLLWSLKRVLNQFYSYCALSNQLLLYAVSHEAEDIKIVYYRER